MSEFLIKDIMYDIGRINAFDQLAISRKALPFITKWQSREMSLDDAFADIPEEDIQLIFERALPSVKRKVGEAWFPIYNKQVKQFMYEDITGKDLMDLFFAILAEVVTPFFAEHTQPDSTTK